MLRRLSAARPALFLLLAATAFSMPSDDQARLVVGEGGLLVYPRWNTAFKPIGEAAPGDVLAILQEKGPWKQVRAEALDRTGWVFCEIASDKVAGVELDLPVAASPATTGLVAKGWRAEMYARKYGTDTAAVQELIDRRLSADRFDDFVKEGGLQP